MHIHIGYFITVCIGFIGWVAVSQVQSSSAIAVLCERIDGLSRAMDQLTQRVDTLSKKP